jgi:hypothetical protein
MGRKRPPKNSTLVERISFYFETDQDEKCLALCAVGDKLEDDFAPTLTFDLEELQ